MCPLALMRCHQWMGPASASLWPARMRRRCLGPPRIWQKLRPSPAEHGAVQSAHSYHAVPCISWGRLAHSCTNAGRVRLAASPTRESGHFLKGHRQVNHWHALLGRSCRCRGVSCAQLRYPMRSTCTRSAEACAQLTDLDGATGATGILFWGRCLDADKEYPNP